MLLFLSAVLDTLSVTIFSVFIMNPSKTGFQSMNLWTPSPAHHYQTELDSPPLHQHPHQSPHALQFSEYSSHGSVGDVNRKYVSMD